MSINQGRSINTDNESCIQFKIFRATGTSAWEKPLAAAAQFASTLESNQIINISHSSDAGNGTVVVWFRKLSE